MEIQNHSKNSVISTKRLIKGILCLSLLFFVCFSYGQDNIVKKPERVIIANNEIITMEQAERYAASGYVKVMNNGVSDERRAELLEKFGDKIVPKEFIIEISLYTEEEKLEREKVKHEYIVEEIDTQYDSVSTIKIKRQYKRFYCKND
jgi:hypothetical protein